jgi:hypothetical protein
MDKPPTKPPKKVKPKPPKERVMVSEEILVSGLVSTDQGFWNGNAGDLIVSSDGVILHVLNPTEYAAEYDEV